MNWIYEAIIFVAIMAMFITLGYCGVNWSDYTWQLVGVCVCVTVINITSYKQGITRGSDIASKAYQEAIAENMDATYKVLADFARESARCK